MAHYPHISGWMTEPELEALHDLALDHQPVLEIGCYAGLSTSAFAQAGEVTTVDVLLQAAFIQNMLTAGLLGNITIRVGRSQEIMPKLRAGSYGMVFIDGSHEYADVKSDMQWAQSLIRTDGLIVFDDADWPGVLQAADEILPGWSQCTGKMGIWALR